MKPKGSSTRKKRQEGELLHLPVSRIRGNFFNPRKEGFGGPKFDELVSSIRQKGVLQPIIVRPIKEDDFDYEVIAGERRHRAMVVVSREDPARSTIPGIVRECADDEAFEICITENLQREDLTEPEEAQAFAEYVAKKGDEAIFDLAEKIGVSARYVRKRVEVMRLPKPVLWAWQKEILQFCHLEQFLRVLDKKKRLELIKEIVREWQDSGEVPSALDLKETIDNQAPAFSQALFDRSGCSSCASNSETQRTLFGIGDENALCTNPKCFAQKQREWLEENWPEHLKTQDPELRVNGIRSMSETRTYELLYQKDLAAPCFECESCVSLLAGDGTIRVKRACVGAKDCYKKSYTASPSSHTASSSTSSSPDVAGQTAPKQSSEGNEEEAPKKEWHGEYFREEFFKEAIPEKAKEFDPLSDEMIRLVIFAIVSSNSHIHEWFATRLDLPKKPQPFDYGFFLRCSDILPALLDLPGYQLPAVLKEAAVQVLLSNRTVLPNTRRKAAEFLGIDLTKEWRITQDYLDKKTKSEIVGIIQRFKVLDKPEAWQYTSNVCGLKKKTNVGKLKKEQLCGIFLKSGIDLSGIVPSEIIFNPQSSCSQSDEDKPADSSAQSNPPDEQA